MRPAIAVVPVIAVLILACMGTALAQRRAASPYSVCRRIQSTSVCRSNPILMQPAAELKPAKAAAGSDR